MSFQLKLDQCSSRLSPSSGIRPNFLGIGAAKAGTTTVARLLAGHPEISFPVNGTKELHYFDEKYAKDDDAWYFSQFENNIAIGEYTPSYIFDPECRDRIYKTLGGDIKFIVALRNPVDRAFSHYCHAVNNWWQDKYRALNYPVEGLSFEDAIDKESERLGAGNYHIRHLSYFSKGLYAEQLKRFFEVFPKDNFYIYLYEDYIASPAHILKNICTFLGVDEHFEFQGTDKVYNTQTNRIMAHSTRRKLNERYGNSIKELEDLLGRDLSVWTGKGKRHSIGAAAYTHEKVNFYGMRKTMKDPIFVVGSPRSGTTLLQCMLSVSENAFSLPETHYFCSILPRLGIRPTDKINQDNVKDIIDLFYEKMVLDIPEYLMSEFFKKAESGQLTAVDILIDIFDLFRPADDSARIRRVIEKTPFHVQYLRDIVESFPDAKFLNIIRDPRDVVSSRMMMPMAHTKSFRLYALEWNRSIGQAQRFLGEFPGSLLSIRYEDLVEKTGCTLNEVCQFLNLPFRDEMVSKFAMKYESCTLHKTESWKEEVKTGRIRNKRGIWQNRITPATAWLIEQETTELMKLYEYAPSVRPSQSEINNALENEDLVLKQESGIDTIIQIGTYYSEERKHASAREIYENAILFENITRQDRNKLLLRIGNILLDEGRYHDAEGKFAKALAINGLPEIERFHVLLGFGRSCFAEKKYHEAEQKFADALLLGEVPQKERFNAHLFLGRCYAALKRYVDAEDQYREALSMDVPNETKISTVLHLGKCLSEQGKSEEEKQEYLSALSEGGIAAIWKYRLLNRLGILAFQCGTYESAEKRYTEALSIEGVPGTDRYHALTGLGKCCIAQKKYDEAEKQFEEALSCDTISATSRIAAAEMLVDCCLLRGKLKKVEQVCEMVMLLEGIDEQLMRKFIIQVKEKIKMVSLRRGGSNA